MSSAWGNSWANAWGNSWGQTGATQGPVYFPKVTGRRIQWDAVVRMAGGLTQPHPYEVYRFGGGKVQRSFFEDV